MFPGTDNNKFSFVGFSNFSFFVFFFFFYNFKKENIYF